MLFLHFCPPVQPFKRKSIIFVSPCTKTLPKSTTKDTFHNLIFGIDKKYILYILDSTTLTKLSLSKGGGGWRKTFKVALRELRLLSKNLSPQF